MHYLSSWSSAMSKKSLSQHLLLLIHYSLEKPNSQFITYNYFVSLARHVMCLLYDRLTSSNFVTPKIFLTFHNAFCI